LKNNCFSINGAGAFGYSWPKSDHGPKSMPYTKINYKCVASLKQKTIKLLKENRRKSLEPKAR
jgi:hypothetical protein